MKRKLMTALVLGVSAAAGVTGCNNNRVDEPLEARPQISLVASNREIVAGDTTTLTVNSRNTLGRDAEIEWIATGGRLSTDENDRVARLAFDEAGVYTVTAVLHVDGREVDRESVNITVRPLK